jgi:hypothetical protein
MAPELVIRGVPLAESLKWRYSLQQLEGLALK